MNARVSLEIERQRRDALIARVRNTRTSLTMNLAKIEGGDSKKDYVWVNKHDDRRAYFEGMQYVICTNPNINTRWRQKDGTIRRGDMILYEVDKDWRQAIRDESAIRALNGITEPRRQFKVAASEMSRESGVSINTLGG